MAELDKKASALDAAADLTGTESWAGIQSSGDVLISADQVAEFILAIVGRGVEGLITFSADEATSQRTVTLGSGLVVLKMGYFRETIVSEVTRTVVFATPFPSACWNVMTQGVIAAPSPYRDLWVQLIPGLMTANQFTVQFQSDDNNDQALSGFDWWAFGN